MQITSIINNNEIYVDWYAGMVKLIFFVECRQLSILLGHRWCAEMVSLNQAEILGHLLVYHYHQLPELRNEMCTHQGLPLARPSYPVQLDRFSIKQMCNGNVTMEMLQWKCYNGGNRLLMNFISDNMHDNKSIWLLICPCICDQQTKQEYPGDGLQSGTVGLLHVEVHP